MTIPVRHHHFDTSWLSYKGADRDFYLTSFIAANAHSLAELFKDIALTTEDLAKALSEPNPSFGLVKLLHEKTRGIPESISISDKSLSRDLLGQVRNRGTLGDFKAVYDQHKSL